MIYKSTKYGNVENVTVAHFGNGTISICNSTNGIFMKSVNKSKIGEIAGTEGLLDEFKPEIAIFFTNKESFDVFYEYVQNVKATFDDPIENIKLKALTKICLELEVTITYENTEGKATNHIFTNESEAIEFIDEFFRTASEDEEIYIAE